METKASFRGWVVIIGLFFIMATPFAVIFLAHSIFLTPVTEKLGWTATQFSLVFTIIGLATGIASPFVGNLIRKVNIKYFMAISGAVTSIGFGALGAVKEVWQFYLLSAIVGVACTGITQLPVSNIATNWFPNKKKGLATGIAFAGGNVGAFIVILTISKLIERIGYEKCYFILGGIMLVVTVVVSLFVIVGKPSDINQLPYGVTEAEVKPKNNNNKEKVHIESGLTFKEVKTTPMFWVYIIAIVLLGCVFSGVQMHIPSYLQSVGHSMQVSSNITSVRYVTGIISNVFIGFLLEKAGLRNGLIIVGVFMVLAIGSLLFAASVPFAFIFAILFGVFTGIASMGPAYLTSEIFGQKDYGKIFGFVIMFFQFGGAVGPTISGFIYDATGKYQLTWVIFIVLLVITFATFLISLMLGKKKKSAY